jgi:hypothetical protein
MKQYFSFSVVSRIVASILLFWAFAQHQYGYFVLLRWIVCGVSIYCSYLSYSKNIISWTWVFGFVAILFNPFAPIRLDRLTWAYFDIAIGFLLLVSIILVKESNSTKNKSNGA